MHSEETKRKISEAKKGSVPWNKGKKTGLIPKTAFKKGFIPWCVRVAGTGLMKAWNKGMKFPEKSGENHFAWKGGQSKSYKHQTSQVEYRIWRKSVFERDNYTCQECGRKNLYLTAHHIKGWSQYPELRYELSNGQTLCEACHSLTDNYKGRGRTKVLLPLLSP